MPCRSCPAITATIRMLTCFIVRPTRLVTPVLLKASAGVGKGMRVVERTEEFAAALASCKRKAASSFGNDRVPNEKYLTRPRHVLTSCSVS